MASPSEDQPKKEPGQSSPTGHAQLPRNHPPPPETGYPPVMGYPHPNPPYQGYNGYPYLNVQPPPAVYYPPESFPSPISGFIRGCLTVMIVFVFLSFVSTIMVWLILRPEIPVFRVDTFSVSNLNTSSNLNFTANWDANVTVENPNNKLNVYIYQIDSFMYYKDIILSSSSKAESVFLHSNGHGVLPVNLSTKNTDAQPVVDQQVVDDMGRDRNGGSVSFNFRMLVSSTFRSGGWWTRGAKLKVFCNNLKVGFVGATSNGILLPPEKPGAGVCSVYA